MPGIPEFLRGLSENQWETLVRVVQDLQDSTSADRLETLKNFIQAISREIDSVNKKRDSLGHKINNLEAMLPAIDDFMQRHPEDTEIALFRNLLNNWRGSLKIEIQEMRPNGKLDKKYDTERKREFLTHLQSLVTTIGRHVVAAKKGVGGK